MTCLYVLLYPAMACPFFYPVARWQSDCWVVPPRLPLGDAYTGECRAEANPFQPDDTRMRQTCNVGYGRSCCERFPAASQADAVRFNIAADAGQLIRIQYIFEKDCWPQQHGMLECSVSAEKHLSGTEDELLRSQAAAFVESYLRRRG